MSFVCLMTSCTYYLSMIYEPLNTTFSHTKKGYIVIGPKLVTVNHLEILILTNFSLLFTLWALKPCRKLPECWGLDCNASNSVACKNKCFNMCWHISATSQFIPKASDESKAVFHWWPTAYWVHVFLPRQLLPETSHQIELKQHLNTLFYSTSRVGIEELQRTKKWIDFLLRHCIKRILCWIIALTLHLMFIIRLLFYAAYVFVLATERYRSPWDWSHLFSFSVILQCPLMKIMHSFATNKHYVYYS